MSLWTRIAGAVLLAGALVAPAASFAQSSDFSVPLPSGDVIVPDDYDADTDGNSG
ncbi:hypothetical protein HY251_18675 [bacterium]|nr:hypothetical protein [bacterium]